MILRQAETRRRILLLPVALRAERILQLMLYFRPSVTPSVCNVEVSRSFIAAARAWLYAINRAICRT